MTAKYSKYLFLAILMFLCATQMTFANSVPAIFGAALFHLIFINLLVIVVESVLLKKVSGSSINPWYIVLANFASVILAYTLTDATISGILDMDWFGLSRRGFIPQRTFLYGVAAFIGFTILVEWPFFHWAQKNKKQWFRSLKYAALINLVTNIPIAIFYLTTGNYYSPLRE